MNRINLARWVVATILFLTGNLAAESDQAELITLIQLKGCANCHGTKGQGNKYMKGPKLAGQAPEELINKLKAYRSGENDNPTMAIMSARLTDKEISQLAEYFSQFK
ncbi:c-type cytochrome [Sansalvadorimonas sp. 2012CJ34-2]|uniref:C-type cytochrome n=1 Tax=Parendozoicomonas callyspongiae TaxID=2942213 RepID=A0ABT0PJH5_9GAMM|nr:c-type cytochrome [Sansalvadorimonas sp. 2012CJ34-2]MCL6271499.1 c-type cytochrome [Sansalvadorimonas sp. 2012CJ34-2]